MVCRRYCYTSIVQIMTQTIQNITSKQYFTGTHHGEEPLPLGTVVLKRNFSHIHVSDNLKSLIHIQKSHIHVSDSLKLFRIGPKNIWYTDVTYELLFQGGSSFHTYRNHLIPYYPKEPFYTLIFSRLN